MYEILEGVKIEGRGHQYDSVIGISGGVDSCFVTHLAYESGLRPLVVHFDNGGILEIAPDPRERRRIRIEHHEHSVAKDEGLVERALPRVAPDVFAELVLVVRVRAHMPHANAHADPLILRNFRELGLGCINTDPWQIEEVLPTSTRII